MNRALAAAAIALALAGCRSTADRELAPVADADRECYARCTPSLTDTGVRWDVDPEDPAAWDVLGDEVVRELSGTLLACERRRQACAHFIDALKQRGVIRAKE